MNIYDTRLVRCAKCDKFIGEIKHDSQVAMPICGQCNNSTSGMMITKKLKNNDSTIEGIIHDKPTRYEF